MFDFKQLQESDPLKRMVERQIEQVEYSPMAIPEAYAPLAGAAIPYEMMPPFLQKLKDDHNMGLKELDAGRFTQGGWWRIC